MILDTEGADKFTHAFFLPPFFPFEIRLFLLIEQKMRVRDKNKMQHEIETNRNKREREREYPTAMAKGGELP